MLINILLVCAALTCLFMTAILASILLSIFRSGKHSHNETVELQGGLDHVVRGIANPSFDIETDPRFVEGFSRKKSDGSIQANNRLSDDYIKNMLGA